MQNVYTVPLEVTVQIIFVRRGERNEPDIVHIRIPLAYKNDRRRALFARKQREQTRIYNNLGKPDFAKKLLPVAHDILMHDSIVLRTGDFSLDMTPSYVAIAEARKHRHKEIVRHTLKALFGKHVAGITCTYTYVDIP